MNFLKGLLQRRLFTYRIICVIVRGLLSEFSILFSLCCIEGNTNVNFTLFTVCLIGLFVKFSRL